jgi:predicted membrane chloride channel (bestrophin family)
MSHYYTSQVVGLIGYAVLCIIVLIAPMLISLHVALLFRFKTNTTQSEAAEYGRLYAQRMKEAKEARRSIISKRRSSRKASAKVEA